MNIKQILTFLFLSLGFVLGVCAQDILSIHGSVRNKSTSKKMPEVSIIVSRDGVEFSTEHSNANGKFDIELPLGYRYQLKFTKKDFVHKIIQFDSKNIPAEDMEGGFDYPLEITLFNTIEGLDMSIFDQPVGKAKFDSETNAIEFDKNYTAIMQQKIDDELERLENLEFNKNQLRKDFDLLVERGDDKVSKKKYSEAIGKYQQALKLFPDDAPVKQKIADAQAKIDAEKAGKEKEARYNQLISEGNSLMKKQEWKSAKAKYEKALEIKPNEDKPKKQIEEINKLLENLMNRDLYNDLVDQGDRKMQSEDYEDAIEKYEEANKLIPTEKYPKNQIKKARELIAAREKALADQAALDKKYEEKMALADSNFSSEKFQEARDLYVQAQSLKPEENRPPEQIRVIDEIFQKAKEQELLDKQRDDQLAAQRALDELYQSIVDEANVLYSENNLEEAKSKYQEALKHKPDEIYPKSKIDDINSRLAEMAENALKEEREKANNDAMDKLNQEFQAYVDEGESLLGQDQLEEAIAQFQKALEVKPMEKLPKSKIIFIQKLIETRNNASKENDRLAELERKKQEDAAEQARLDEEARLQREAQEEMLAEQKRKREEEEERKRLEKEEFESRKGGLLSEIDTSREREVERFYRDAKQSSEAAKGNKIEAKKEKIKNDTQQRAQSAQRRREDSSSGINGKKYRMEQVFRDGNETRDLRLMKQQNAKKNYDYSAQEKQQEAEIKREHNTDRIREKQLALADHSSETFFRQERVNKSQERKSNAEYQEAVYARQGETGRLDNQYEVERKKLAIENHELMSEDIRRERAERMKYEQEQMNQRSSDVSNSSRVKRDATRINITEKKKQLGDAGSAALMHNQENASEIDRKKKMASSGTQQNQLSAKMRRLDDLEARREQTTGSPTDERNYKTPKGYEDIPEGITETSYKIGPNKDVIERTVKIGNKVDVYRKVISKYGTAYFKNDHSITKVIWNEETVRVTD